MPSLSYAAALEEARASNRVILDLTESDPARCGLGWDAEELLDIEGRRSAAAREVMIPEAREAISSYLAGHGASIDPQRVFLVRSRREALRLVLDALCDDASEVLVPVPGRPFLDSGTPVRQRRYALVFEEKWRIDRQSIQRALTASCRAILVGNPADPTGASLSREELGFLGHLCEAKQLALVGDESLLDSLSEPTQSVASSRRCFAIHIGGLGGVCGLPELEGEWLAVGGPDALAQPLASRLASMTGADLAGARRGVALLPALLGRREAFLSRLRARLTKNRSTLATASLREAPWTMQWGGGYWAVLQINPNQDEDELCLALLEEGIAVQPGSQGGFPQQGYLILSLLPKPAIFDAALGQIEAQLRRPA
jgi:aspartate/methionine/tyrosine aminotransferase